MALFENEEFEEDENSYLTNTEKGIELIRTLISPEDCLKSTSGFEEILQRDILPLIAELELQNETEIYRSLKKISDRITEQKKVHILEGKKIVGIGGKFSAGKSCFINSITNATLPEGQRPTTSIATYIVNAEQANNIVITNSDECVEIDDEAVEALAHAFYEKYAIGFSKLIKNLVVYTPGFTYPNVAILDTPGYSKSDTNKSEDSSDAEIAREQLKSVDYLIWLVDSNQGTVTQRDLDFMHSLNVKNDVLVVFTKASMKTDSELKKIIDEAKQTLKNGNRSVFDVIAYDSLLKKEMVGEGSLKRYFDMINAEADVGNTPECQLKQIKEQLDEQLCQSIKELLEWDKDTSKIIANTTNVEHIDSMVKEYIRNKAYLGVVTQDRADLIQYMDDLIKYYKIEVG